MSRLALCSFLPLALAACDNPEPPFARHQAALDDVSEASKKLPDHLGQIVYRPGDPAGTRENVWTEWAGAYKAVEALRELGQVNLEFDARFAPAVHIPAGTWLMNDVIWTDTHRDGVETRVVLDDGCSIQVTNQGNTLQVVGDSLSIVSDRTGPVAPFAGVSLLFSGVRTRIYNTSAMALPAFVVNAGALNFIGLKDSPLGGIGNDAALAAPLIDVNGGTFVAVGFSGHVDDNAFTGTGTVQLRELSDNFNGAIGAFENYNFPAFTGAVQILVRSRDRHRIEGIVTAPTYNALYNELVRVNTNANEVTVTAPRASPAKGERLVVKDVGGNATINHITMAGSGGDTVEDSVISINGQAKMWVSDGIGHWLHIGTN
jgi:hypothetical protein